MKKIDIYETVTNLIVERLEAGVVPWQMPFKSAQGLPQNLVSKKPYRGFNFWYLLSFGFERPYFLTFNQIKDLGASVKKGSKSYMVIFWKMIEVEKDGEKEEIPMLRYYRVFHIDDIEGLSEDKIPEVPTHENDFDPIALCDELIEFWHDSPIIRLNRNKACYIPSLDEVYMPNPKSFVSSEAYFSVLYHEAIHATGHRKRLNRHEKFSNLNFANKDFYSQEELVAEMGAAYLCGICGIENATIDNSAAYIQGWLKKLKNDKKFIVSAAGLAQKAVDYILEHQKPTSVAKPVPVKRKRRKKVKPMALAF